MDVARRRADVLGDVGEERDHVVIGRPLDLANPFDVEFRAPLDRREIFPGNPARFARQNLNLQPDGEFVLLGPDLAHHLAAVPANHNPARLADDPGVVNAPPTGIMAA